MDDRTRDSGSFSNLSDSGRRAAVRLGQRRRSTVEVGRSDLFSVPRSTAKHGRRRRSSRYGHDVELGVALSFLRTRCRRTQLFGVAGDDVSVQLNVGHRTTAHSTRLEALHGRPSRALSERLYCWKSVVELRGTVDDNKTARNSRSHANCSELTRTRMFLREKTTPHTELELFSRPRTVQVTS